MTAVRKTALVTGHKGQLGKVWMAELYKMGADKVMGADLPQYDISDMGFIWALQADVNKALGTPDIIVNNAAIDNPPGTVATFHGDAWQIIGTNLIGAVNVTRAFLPGMIDRGSGLIINIGSIMGFIGADQRNYPKDFEKPVAYNLSKAALSQYSRSLTTQYGKDGIRSVTIAFGPYGGGGNLLPEFLDKFLQNTPMGRPVSLESVKAALRFAIDCPEFAGQTVLIDGGYCAF